jgi:hypothetical protein
MRMRIRLHYIVSLNETLKDSFTFIMSGYIKFICSPY